MNEPAVADAVGAADDGFALTPQQVTFFETFGYLKLPGLFADDIDEIEAAFEQVFAESEHWVTNTWLHFDDERRLVLSILDRHPRLAALWTDPRVLGVVDSLMHGPWERADSDGNLFYCDSSWHPDTYGSKLSQHNIKLSFYLDPLRAETGAIRMIPGSNHHRTDYTSTLYTDLERPENIEANFGVSWDEIPSHVIETDPGDLAVWEFRTVHASIGGNARRRLFSMSFRETED